jgi:hypothetical protein
MDDCEKRLICYDLKLMSIPTFGTVEVIGLRQKDFEQPVALSRYGTRSITLYC